MTIIRSTAPGPGLLRRLREDAHDDGEPDLLVHYEDDVLIVVRVDGHDLSETEEIEVRALLAADDVAPLR